MQRLHNSARLLYMQLPFTVDELKEATNELLAANGLPECYIRPIAFYGYGQLGVAARSNPVETVIMSWPWGTYLGDQAMSNGIRAKISSWQRVSPNIVPHVSKATGVYINSMLAVTEANNAGYDEAILLTPEGPSPTAPARTSSSSATASSTHRASTRGSCPASLAIRSRRSRRTSATRSWRRGSSAPISTSPTRCSCAAPPPR